MFALVIMAAAVFVSLAAGIILSLDLGEEAAGAIAAQTEAGGPKLS